MLKKFATFCGASFALLVVCANPAKAATIDTAYATVNCNAYDLWVTASDLVPGTNYQINYAINLQTSSGVSSIPMLLPFTAKSTTYNGMIWGPVPAQSGTVSFSGIASLNGSNTIGINFSPTSLTCGPSPQPTYAADSANSSNFNGTSVSSGDWIWLNANFTAQGIPATGAVITFTSSTISGVENASAVPNARIDFSPSATCSSTTFNPMTNTWITTVPISGDDEILLTGLAVPVPSSGMQGGGNVSWSGTFSSSVPGVSIDWKWGAAAYSSFTTDYNALAVKSGHQTACGQGKADHAGVPEGVNNDNQQWKRFVVGGARGGGGSNWTGSWSGTQSVSPAPVQSGPTGPKG
jgi:hypothetical protein